MLKIIKDILLAIQKEIKDRSERREKCEIYRNKSIMYWFIVTINLAFVLDFLLRTDFNEITMTFFEISLKMIK
jgi:hypothetical protein